KRASACKRPSVLRTKQSGTAPRGSRLSRTTQARLQWVLSPLPEILVQCVLPWFEPIQPAGLQGVVFEHGVPGARHLRGEIARRGDFEIDEGAGPHEDFAG